MSDTGYELMTRSDTGPYRWPSDVQWRRMTRDERIATAERLGELAKERAAKHYKDNGWETDAMRQARFLLELARAGGRDD